MNGMVAGVLRARLVDTAIKQKPGISAGFLFVIRRLPDNFSIHRQDRPI